MRPDKADEVDRQQGLDEASDALDEALSRWPEVTSAVSQMQTMRERNHFADSFRLALKGE